MKKLISVFLALALCCALIPAVAEEASLAGTWYISRAQADGMDIRVIDPEAMVLTVSEDGTFTLTVSSFGVTQTGTWKVEDAALKLIIDEENTSSFLISGDELVYEMGTNTVYLARTPAEAVQLPGTLPAESAEQFNGTWAPHAQMTMGLYAPFNAQTAEAIGKLSIQDGKMNLMAVDDEGKPYVSMSYDLTFADGMLTAEEAVFQTKMTLSLLTDGTLCYRAVMDMGGMNMESVYFYVPDAEAIIAKMPEPGWVLDSVNGAVWQDDRASLEVFLEDVDNYKVLITWSSSAWETTEWVYACDYDAETQTLKARYVVCDDLVYDDAGNDERTNVYEKDSEAVFSLDEEGKLVLRNAGDEALEGKTFVNVSALESDAQ